MDLQKKIMCSAIGCVFGTSLMIGLATANQSAATPPTLKISGYTAIDLYGADQKNRRNGRGAGYHLTANDSNLFLTISGKSAADFVYGYKLVLESLHEAATFTQNYVEFQYGVTVQLGSVSGFERSGLQDASRLMGGTGGFSGMLDHVYNFSAGAIYGVRPIGDTRYTPKIVVWSPEWEGLRFVVGFTPNTSQHGDAKLSTFYVKDSVNKPGNKVIYPNDKKACPFGLNSIVTGLALHREIADDWDIKFSVSGLFDRSYISPDANTGARIKVRNTATYQVGGIIGYKKFQIGGGFLDNGKSRLPIDDSLRIDGKSLGNTWKGNSGKAWNVGGAYIHGAYQFALAYQHTNRKTDAVNKATCEVTSATISVTPLQGLQVYAETNMINTKTNAAAVAIAQSFLDKPNLATGNNHGLISLAGVKLSF